MIFDRINNYKTYQGIRQDVYKALEFLSQFKESDFKLGRTELDNGDYLVCLSYDTKLEQDSLFEVHRKYIDVMLVLEGQEKFLYANIDRVGKPSKEYSENDDVSLWNISSYDGEVKFLAGDVAIFFSEDVHAPGIQLNGIHTVRKVIVKVKINK